MTMPVSTLIPALLAALMAASLPGCGSRADTVVTIRADGTAHVGGAVIRNQRGCRRDAACWLELRPAGGTPVVITYHHGEGGPPCADPARVARALAIEPGVHVEAEGPYRAESAWQTVDVCTTPGATLRTTGQAAPPVSSNAGTEGSGTSPGRAVARQIAREVSIAAALRRTVTVGS